MPQRPEPGPILRTKLYRPPVAADVVRRGRLHDRLDEGRRRPLTLVSAPAGYGKSTLVSHWLETRTEPCAWLSLDETESDLRVFLDYLVAVVRTIAPEACPKTLALRDAEALPEAPVLAGLLINELDAIEAPFILALDDYHRIREPGVHELLSRLLEHPPRPLHLVLISRRDPPLNLSSLRARGQVSEIRLRDLQFSAAETAEVLKGAVRASLAPAALERLHERTEGWVVGLRLVTLSLDRISDLDSFLERLESHAHQVQDYLVSEVLAHQPAEIQELLLRISILDRFGAPLCDALQAPVGDNRRFLIEVLRSRRCSQVPRATRPVRSSPSAARSLSPGRAARSASSRISARVWRSCSAASRWSATPRASSIGFSRLCGTAAP